MDSGSISLEEALQRVDARGTHARHVLLASLLACFCGGMGGSIAPFLTAPITEEGSYKPWAISMLASSMFAGMWAGSFVGGITCDMFGPGRMMLASLVSLALGGIAPVVSVQLAIGARFFVGLSLCAIYQAANTYVAESVATAKRSTYLSMLHVFIAVGGLATTFLAVSLQDHSWRLLLSLNSLPPLFAIGSLARFVLHNESPRWLLLSGKPGACDLLLRRMARSGAGLAGQGGSPLPPISLQVRPAHADAAEGGRRDATGTECTDASLSASSGSAGGTITCTGGRRSLGAPRNFSLRARCVELATLWRLHAYGCALSFCLNFGSKGSEIWVGAFVEQLGLSSISRTIYMSTMIGKISGDFLNMWASQRFGRLRCLQMGFAGCALSTLGFVVPLPPTAAASWLLVLAFIQGAAMDVLWCNLYIYLVERFPTSVRSTGFGVAMGLGRSGGIVSSALGGLVQSMTSAFVAYAGAFAVGAVIALRPAVETARRVLIDVGGQ